MGIKSFFSRIFGGDKPENAAANPAPQDESTPPERVGPNGEYDQSGLAKRVAIAFDDDPDTQDFENLWVAQTGSTVVLKGEVPTQEDLDQLVNIASGVNGATEVNTDEVSVG
ncbi:MAG: BON domain-containing protein [Cyanobacteriota bacterium]|nr:BON domain-containing protein [Cyanobacteriota bacterium]